MAAFEPPGETLLRPASFLLWGPERLPVELLALGIADRIDPEFQWVSDLCGSSQELHHPLGPVGELVPSDRRVVVGFLEEQFTVPEYLELAIRTMIRSKPVDPALVRLTTFAALPRALQVALGRSSRGPRPGAIILANGHHLRDRWVDSVFGEALFHDFLRSQNASLLVTFLEAPPPSVRDRFDYIYRVDVEPGNPWLRARVFSEKQRAPASSGRGETVSAMSLGPFSDAVVAALSRRGHTGRSAGLVGALAAP
ncbi:MAG: hypothetical protein L3K19_06450 [Thermoplasmata archaeon]|nr:hypothetical protein [Thermoplasmata archaeon]